MDLIEASKALNHPTRVFFGQGSFDKFLESSSFENILVVTSPGAKERDFYQEILRKLHKSNVHEFRMVDPNPEVSRTVNNFKLISNFRPDCILAVGGGSVIDTAKVFSRMFSQVDTIWSNSELLSSKPIVGIASIPVVAVPTTAGSGSEFTPFATLWDIDEKKKISIAGDDLYPMVAIIDPSYSLSGPSALKVSTGLDSVSHAFDSYWSKKATALTRAICIESLTLSFGNLLTHLSHPDTSDLQSVICESSALSGIAISSTKTSLGHAISYPITMMIGVPHGIAASFTIPGILDLINLSDPERCLEFASLLGFESFSQLRSAFVNLILQSNAVEVFFQQAIDLSDLLKLAPEMQSKERFDNFYKEITLEELALVVSTSFGAMTQS
jgi:alcohol dehydrogenase